MEQQHTAGTLGTTISIISAAITIVTSDIQTYISATAGMVAIVSGCMAIRFYYYSTKKVNRKNDETN